MILVTVGLAADALTLAVDVELHLVGIVVVAPKVDCLTRQPVPVRKEMKHRLGGPLALIHIIGVLRETGQVDDAKVTATCRIAVGRGLTDVVPACPDKLPGAVRRVLDDVPSLLVGRTPRSMAVVIGRAHHRRVGIRLVPSLRCYVDAVGRHTVVAARLQGRDALCHEKRLAGEVLRHVLDPLTMVVEADKIQGARLEEMVVGRGLVASCRDRTALVEASDDVGEMDGEQRVG